MLNGTSIASVSLLLPNPKASPKTNPTNRIPGWIFSGEFTQQVKQDIIADRMVLSRTQQIYLIRQLMESRPQKIDKIMLRKLLMDDRVCPKFTAVPFELAMHFLELDWKPRGTLITKYGDFYDKVLLLIEGTCEALTQLGEVIMYEGYGLFGEKEMFRVVKSESTIRCKTDCWFLTIKKIDYFSAYRKYRAIENKELQDFIVKVPIIRTFGEEVLKKLCPLFQKVDIVEKEHLIWQDKTPNWIIIIAEGQFKALYLNALNQQSVILHLGPCEILGLQSLLQLPSQFDIICSSKTSTIYRIGTQKFVRTLQNYSSSECPFWRELRQFAEHKMQIYAELVDKHNARIGFLKLARAIKKESAQEIHTEPGEDIKLRTKYFSKDMMKTRLSTTTNCWSIRSKKEQQPRQLYSMFASPEDENFDSSKAVGPVSPMMAAYKEKLKRSNIQLDLIEQLYRKTRRRRRDLSVQMFRPGHRSKQQETEVLMKRIQQSSCKKRRNRNICLFDPQQVVKFASFSQEL